jgi:hypothetical protein
VIKPYQWKTPCFSGILFAANLGSPDFFAIFDEIMETPVTNVKLEKMLTAYKTENRNQRTRNPYLLKRKLLSYKMQNHTRNATARFPKGRNYMKKYLPPPIPGQFLFHVKLRTLRGFPEASTSGRNMPLSQFLDDYF